MVLRFVLSFWIVFAFAVSLHAAEQQQIAALLKREIVGPVLPLAEVQRYCEEKVPKMPKVELAAEWEAEAARLRAAVLEKIVYRGGAAKWRNAKTKVEWLDTIEGGPGYSIKKLRYEALPGLWIPALLYEPEKLAGRVPAVLNVNGHTALGKQYPAKQLRCINQAKRGMLALNVEWLGMGQLRSSGNNHARMNQLDLCGTSGLAPFYLCMKRGLDVLLSLENTDPDRVAMTGLSGGGWQTIILSSLDTRVKLANPVAGYSSFRTRARHFKDLGDSEQTPNDLATLVDYTHLTAMMAPRPTLLTYNSKDDCCFESGYAMKPLTAAAMPAFRLFGKQDALRTHVNDDPGTHNYEVDNRQAFYRALGDFFFAGDDKFNRKEIPSEKEVKSEKDLAVELPEGNEDFHTLALALCKQLPREPKLPAEKTAAVKWQRDRRTALGKLVRAKPFKVGALKTETEKLGDVTVNFWRLQMDGDWTLPATEFVPAESKKTAIVAADAGRASVAAHVARLLASGHRVIAVDPFYFGESKISQKAFLFAVLVAGVGDRPLGLQASQLAAVARWTTAEHQSAPVTLVAVGPRSSTFTLIAAGLEEKAVAGVELHESLATLKEVIEKDWTVSQTPELFCFGLLEAFDLKQLAATVAPRPVSFIAPSDRAKQELAGLATWYRTLGSNFRPLGSAP
ncbi:MAG: acetylxylan esterase [Candidatus Nealsonbacteria bacterium]|nr:acetylxylan esterase [Candidatus Nealsonbacteria bacterium]